VPPVEEVRIMPKPDLAGVPEDAGTATAVERRASPRIRYAYSCGPVVRYLQRPGQEVHQAVLHDLSAEGAGLLVGTAPAPEALLLVQLGCSPRLGTSHTRLARVVHVTPREGNVWLVGCWFTAPLSPSELEDVAGLVAAG
jgi:hypothetical protein